MKTKLFKILTFVLLFVLTLSGCNNKKPSSSSSSSSGNIDYSGDVIVHYYRFSEDYKDWLCWIWPSGSDGGRFTFQTQKETVNNQKWAVISIDLDYKYTTLDWNGATNVTVDFTKRTEAKLGIIPRDTSGAKDMTTDRFIDLNQNGSDGKVHAYIIEGNADIYYSLDDVPKDKIKTASYATFSTVKVSTFVPLTGVKPSDFSFTCEDPNKTLTIDTGSNENYISGSGATLKLKTPIDETFLAISCRININNFGSKVIDATTLYSTQEFKDKFSYDGELGAITTPGSTTFRVWAPTAKSVTLNLYTFGNGDETPVKKVMNRIEKGVYEYVEPANLHGKYYTYDVTLGSTVNKDVVDPYAKSAGLNGLRGLVVDMTMSDVTPANWESVTTPTLENYNDAVIYELHTRDLTMSDTWNGTAANKGKFAGLIETGTTYQGNPTGFDYIKSLGVTHVQLLPIYDYKSVDESRLNDQSYINQQYGGVFNWGYDPQNYNAIEGSYSSDPSNGLVRVKELREVTAAYNKAGIGIIMDVVYNHMPNGADSSFDKIVPGYYFRKNSYSGAGTDTASERPMFRKFMIDSTEMWAKEYKLSGFRFDLMGLHDVTTMNQLAENLRTKVKDDIIILGEAWNMYNGSPESPLLNSSMASQAQLPNMKEIAAFNDGIRDGLKGNVFDTAATGFLQNPTAGNNNTVRWAIIATAKTDQITSSLVTGTGYTSQWHATNPGVSINYVEAHDNLTLHDKLVLSAPNKTEADYLGMQSLANSIILLSQGTPFMHAGVEMMRSKKMPANFTKNDKMVCVGTTNTCYSSDSYNASDKINAIDWSLVESNKVLVNRVKDLIEIRKTHPIFSSTSFGSGQDSLANRLRFITGGPNSIIAYTITKEPGTSESWSTALVIHNSSSTAYNFTLPTGSWKLAYNGTNKVNGTSLSSTYSVPAYGTIIAYID
jgi:pullulanase